MCLKKQGEKKRNRYKNWIDIAIIIISSTIIQAECIHLKDLQKKKKLSNEWR